MPVESGRATYRTGLVGWYLPRDRSLGVDTTGRADMSTFKVLKTTHDLFTNAVKSTLPNMKFYPAEVGGKKVRQLVQMPFQFSLTKGE